MATTWNCPNCGGWGHMNDGGCGAGTDGEGKPVYHYKPSTKCWVCNGEGKVTCVPASQKIALFGETVTRPVYPISEE